MTDAGAPPARRPRADAERNRARPLSAKTVFAERGRAASLDEIARAAGVGIGTLYRRFPTRDALVEAVYRNESDQLFAAAARLARTRPPVEALRAWLLLFVDHLAVKRGMSEALGSIAGGGDRAQGDGGREAEGRRGVAGRARRRQRRRPARHGAARSLAGAGGAGVEPGRTTTRGHSDRRDAGAAAGGIGGGAVVTPPRRRRSRERGLPLPSDRATGPRLSTPAG